MPQQFSAPPSDLLPSLQARAAQGSLNSASGVVRWWNGAPPTEEELVRGIEREMALPNTVIYEGRELSGAEFMGRVDKQLDDARRVAETLQGLQGKPGHTTAEDAEQFRAAQHKVAELESVKQIGLKQVDPVARRAKLEGQAKARLASWKRNNELADDLAQGAVEAFEYYGANPESTNAEAQVGRGLGGFLNAAPGIDDRGACSPVHRPP